MGRHLRGHREEGHQQLLQIRRARFGQAFEDWKGRNKAVLRLGGEGQAGQEKWEEGGTTLPLLTSSGSTFHVLLDFKVATMARTVEPMTSELWQKARASARCKNPAWATVTERKGL